MGKRIHPITCTCSRCQVDWDWKSNPWVRALALSAQGNRPSPNRREVQSRQPGRYVGVKAGFHEKTQTPVTDIIVSDKPTSTHRHLGIDEYGNTIFDASRKEG